ncbi:MAG: glutamate racemase [Firmicutes bacterium]|nr:glutamate racemase [Bacillota bacterium]
MDKSPIGVFDSGVGGISVLSKIIELLPNEKYIYYGDSANAPYGVKSDEEVFAFTEAVFEKLLERGCKAIVVACNTATSVAVRRLREKYSDLTIIGIEPAIKPAAEKHPGGRIVVMATSLTLRRKKFANLMARYGETSEIIPMECPGLVEFVEQDDMDSRELAAYLERRYEMLGKKKADAVVLGCTHYPFVKDRIQEAAGGQAVIYDGSRGTANELKRRLSLKSLLAEENQAGSPDILDTDISADVFSNVEILNSAGKEKAELSWRLLKRIMGIRN